MKNADATYTEAVLPEHKGNPLIEALPPIVDDIDLIRRFKRKQLCEPTEKMLPPHIRRKCVARIGHFLEPSIDYVEVHRAIEDAILQGYTPKNPLKPSVQQYLHYTDYDSIEGKPSDGRFRPRGTAITMVGPSGVGKSYLIDRILDFYPQKISHGSYKKKHLNLDQIVWLKIDCPENISITGLLSAVLSEFDRLTGTNDADRPGSRGDAIAKARVQIEKKLRYHSVGLFVIDEIQNLNINNQRLKDIFLQLILVLINRTGVPILFCGNPEVLEVLKSTLKNARRAESGGFFSIESIRREEWSLFVSHLWRYQWTNIATPLTEELSGELFKLSTGIPDFAVRTFQEAQKLVIGSNEETISCAVLREGYARACALSEDSLSFRRKECLGGAAGRQLKGYNEQEEHNSGSSSRHVDLPDVPENSPKTHTTGEIIADVNRIQHEEFENQINRLRTQYFNGVPPHIEPSLLREGKAVDDPSELYREYGIMFETQV